MNNYIFTDEKGKQYKRIDKRIAKKEYDNGRAVIVCASNLRPFTMYHFECELLKSRLSDFLLNGIPENDFNRVVNHFEFYNCTNSETGYRTNFYIALEN